MSKHIHKYADISRAAQTYGRTSDHAEITHDDMLAYLDKCPDKVQLGTLLRIATAAESIDATLKALNTELRNFGGCNRARLAHKALLKIARNTQPAAPPRKRNHYPRGKGR